jgi:3-isopropylmalate dehydrogenase
VAYSHIDAAMIHLVTDPGRFDVVVTDNLFGDIFTDLAAAVSGGIGLAASGNLDVSRTNPSMFEPVHGSAPDIAGQNKANPLGAIGSVGAMLEYSFGLKEEASAVDAAIEAVLRSGNVTADLRPSGAPATTEQVGRSVCAAIG